MAKKLVILESPGKINKVSKCLGSQYSVLASYGHIFDLPEKQLGVDLKNKFEPTFVVLDDKKDALKQIVSSAKKSEVVYIMTDEDREGCGIARNIYDALKKEVKTPILRCCTNEITKKGIEQAIAAAGDINNEQSKVNSYLCRRILDRIAGYKTSFLTQQATGGRSAGRVQSAVLRIIVDREKEIRAFVPEEYWVLTAHLLSSKSEPFLATLTDKIKVSNEQEAITIYNKVIAAHPVVKSVEQKDVSVNPYPPFTTLPMMATASTVFGWSAEKTMKVAQTLYEGGLCVLPDDVVVAVGGEVLTAEEAVNRHEQSLIGFSEFNENSDFLTSPVDVSAHQKIKYTGKIVHIRTVDGQEIGCTPDHQLLVWDGVKIGYRKAGLLREGDYAVCAKRMQGVVRNLDLGHAYYLMLYGLPVEVQSKIRIVLSDHDVVRDALLSVKSELNQPTYYKYQRENKVPFSVFRKYVDSLCLTAVEEEKFVNDTISSFLWASPFAKPEMFSIEDFFYFLGMCLGDGHITSSTISFPRCITDDEHWSEILKCFGQKLTNSSSIVKFRGQILRNLCVHLGGKVGNKAASIFIHPLISRSSENHLKHFLGGLFDTDGCFNIKHRLQISYTTISARMAKQLNVLLRTMGYLSGIHRRKGDLKNCSVKILRRDAATFLEDIIPFLRVKREICQAILPTVSVGNSHTTNLPIVSLVESARILSGTTKENLSLEVFGDSSSYWNYTRTVNGRNRPSFLPPSVLNRIATHLQDERLQFIANGDEYFTPIKTIRIEQYDGYVYDVSTSTENFICNTFYVHNCTYHRTDSPFMAGEAVTAIRSFVEHAHGEKYLPEKPVFYAAKQGAQEAHECCRPTDVNVQHPHISGDELKLYSLIWKRAVASQMTPGRDRRMKVITDIGGYDFISTGRKSLFDGFRKVWTYSASDDVLLPGLKEGEKCKLQSLEKEQKFTTPPSRFSTASLSKVCEKEQISRPATFANIIKTLKNRKYIVDSKKSFEPTPLGESVVDFLKSAEVCFVDVGFTAQMETNLDQIQENKNDYVTVLSDFWKRLQKDIENGKQIKSHKELSEYDCPKCGAKLLLKHSKWGAFYACSSSTAKSKTGCKFIGRVGEHGEPVEKVVKPKEYADFPCKKCGSKMVKRSSAHGEFFGCEKFPSCRTTSNLEGVFNEPKKKGKWSKKKVD